MAPAHLTEGVSTYFAPSTPEGAHGRVPPDSSRWIHSHEKPRMLEWMTAEEWTRRWPDEHIGVMDPESDASDWPIAGWVFFHHADPDVLFEEALRLRPKHLTRPWTGKIPDDAVFIL